MGFEQRLTKRDSCEGSGGAAAVATAWQEGYDDAGPGGCMCVCVSCSCCCLFFFVFFGFWWLALASEAAAR